MALLPPQTTYACSRGKYGYNVKLIAHIYQIEPNVRMCALQFCRHIHKIKCKI
jgi:hypothetical protein